jgi:hypothetical protein
MVEQSPQEYRALTREELESIAGEELPERVALSLVNANVAAPVDVAAALNVLSEDSAADASAEQTANIDQTAGG